jgi:hypothetical protein
MRRFLAVACELAAIAGCRHTLPASDSPGPLVDVVAPTPPRASFEVVPAELGDAGVLERIRHRVRLKRFGRANTTLAGDDEPRLSRSHTGDAFSVLPVIGEQRGKIRVVIEDDHARYALWVDRDDTWRTITVPTRLANRDGRAIRDAGVDVRPGIPIDVGARVGNLRAVTVRDDQLAIDGWAPTGLLGNIWLVTKGDRTPTDLRQDTAYDWAPPRDANTHGRIALGAVVRAGPSVTAPTIATVTADAILANVGAKRGSFMEIDLFRPYLHVHGFVEARLVTVPAEPIWGHGSGTGHGFGMSHADRIEVTAGACLFDGVDGDVVGVMLETSTHLGERNVDEAGWSLVYVDNPWAVVSLYVRDTGGDPKQPVWESCTAHVW